MKTVIHESHNMVIRARDGICKDCGASTLIELEYLTKPCIGRKFMGPLEEEKAHLKSRMENDIKKILQPLFNPQEKARLHVFNYIKPRLEKTDKHVTFGIDEVYVVWFSKTLQNWKALVSTTLPDGMYYEVTYNGDQHETYIDAYKKFDNVCIKDADTGVHIPMLDSD